ncbi:MAG: putative Holliday junction resolvase [Candidatus Midichloriaceae bacterium]|jgi:putative Holliday junction resolvase
MIQKSKDDFLEELRKQNNFNVLGVDYGEKKIGLAIFRNEINLATPLKVFHKSSGDYADEITKIINKEKIHGLLIGLPIATDGTITEISKKVLIFGEQLSKKIELPIYFFDERFTTSLANVLLKETNMKRKKRNQIDDMHSANIILDNFFR